MVNLKTEGTVVFPHMLFYNHIRASQYIHCQNFKRGALPPVPLAPSAFATHKLRRAWVHQGGELLVKTSLGWTGS